MTNNIQIWFWLALLSAIAVTSPINTYGGIAYGGYDTTGTYGGSYGGYGGYGGYYGR